MRGNAQPGNSVLGKALVAQPIELAFPSNAGQLGVEFGEIERAVKRLAEPMLKSAIRVRIGACDFDGFYFVCRTPSACPAGSQIFLPLHRILNRIRKKSGRLRSGAFAPQRDEVSNARIIRHRETIHSDAYRSLRQSQRAVLVLCDHHGDGAGEHSGERLHFFAVARRKLQFDCDHGIRIHGENGFNRNVLYHGAIRQHPAINLHRSKYARDSHGGAHCLS